MFSQLTRRVSMAAISAVRPRMMQTVAAAPRLRSSVCSNATTIGVAILVDFPHCSLWNHHHHGLYFVTVAMLRSPYSRRAPLLWAPVWATWSAATLTATRRTTPLFARPSKRPWMPPTMTTVARARYTCASHGTPAARGTPRARRAALMAPRCVSVPRANGVQFFARLLGQTGMNMAYPTVLCARLTRCQCRLGYCSQ
jgi:hypothetical protein